jgi:ribonuclease E
MDHHESNGIAPVGDDAVIPTDHEATASAGPPGVVPSFLAELTRAMQAAAEQQREHIAGVVAEDAAGEVEKARTRGAAEADELRRLAEEDVGAIKAWQTNEVERIRREAGRRADERRKELETHLAKHDTIIASEVAGVDVAVLDYRATLDRFFDELRGATDPAEIARLAGSLPPPPDLEGVRSAARATTVAELAREPAEEPAREPEPAQPEPVAMSAPEPVAVEAVDAQPVDSAAEAPAIEAPAIEAPAAEAPAAPSQPIAEDEAIEDEAGVGVMDPDAVRRPGGYVEPAEEPVAAGASAPTSPAARFLRSLNPWSHDEDDPDHPAAPQS